MIKKGQVIKLLPPPIDSTSPYVVALSSFDMSAELAHFAKASAPEVLTDAQFLIRGDFFKYLEKVGYVKPVHLDTIHAYELYTEYKKLTHNEGS